MTARTSFSYKLDGSQQATLRNILTSGTYRPVTMPHTLVAARTEDCTIALYTSGKCLVQGKGAEDFVLFVMEPLVLQAAQVGYEELMNPEATSAHMGIDESGKGDFFGPLVVVSAFVDPGLAETMKTMDVKDSKRITSDRKALALGRELRKLLGRRFSVVKIGPAAYNRLYAKMRNVNTMLAWAHARAIENLLDVIPDCPRAVSDQFGKKEQVERALMQKGRKIELVQRPRAESDIAVAAASIIARELFLRSLLDMGKEHDVEFLKGASSSVRDRAVDLVRKSGPELLLQVAKCHFKTTDLVLRAVGKDRNVLPPEGRVTSKPVQRRPGSR